MKVMPVATQADIKMTTSNNTEARAKAIEAFMRPQGQRAEQPVQAQTMPVANPSSVGLEEMTAIKAATTTQTEQKVDEPTQVATVETKVAEKVEKDPELTKQFAELSRQERILRARATKQQQELKAQQDALAAKQAELEAKSKQYDQGYISLDRLKNDPLSVLAEAELSYDTLTQQMLTQQPRDPRTEAQMGKLEQTIKSLESKLASYEQENKKQRDDSYEQAKKQIKMDATKLVKADAEAYEAIVKTNAIDDVVELIERTYKEEGYLMSVEEAAEEVETYLNDNLYETYSSIEKLKKRIAQSQAAAVVAKPEQEKIIAKEQIQTAKTLTNGMGASPKLSARERAILAFQGKKNG